jgi:hypothetical protein
MEPMVVVFEDVRRREKKGLQDLSHGRALRAESGNYT